MLKSIRLQNFRNYEKLELELSEGNIFIGKNAQGKTNILEAIYLLSNTKSFRSKDSALIKKEQGFFTVAGIFDEGEDLRIVFEEADGSFRKTYQKKGVKVSGKEILGEFVSIIFSPDDVSFFRDSPGARRRYLDQVLCKVNRTYLEELIKFKKLLEQRNALLKRIKEKNIQKEELYIWDDQLVETASRLVVEREKYLGWVNKEINEIYEKLTGERTKIKATLKTEAKSGDEYKKLLIKNEMADIRAGFTTCGPHRDDILFEKEGFEIASFSSRGECRTVVLAFKFCEGKYFKEKIKKQVTYLLDDVFSELDEERREKLFSMIGDSPFVITTTDRDHVSEEYFQNAKLFIVEEGRVRENF